MEDQNETSESELPYLFVVETRLLYAFALKYAYDAAGTWPAGGLPVPADVAQEYMNDENRVEKIIVLEGGMYAIVEA